MEYEVIRSNRRTIAIQIEPDGTVLVKAPLGMSKLAISYFVKTKADWIEKTRKKVLANSSGSPVEKLTEADKKALKRQAKALIEPLLEEYAEISGVTYGKASYRFQKSRWGSCSAEGNLNFNCLLALCPEGVIRYVVVHELCHRRHMDHSKNFWAEVAEYMPDYKEHRKWLRTKGNELIRKL